MRDTLLMLNVWFAFSALAAFSILREFIYFFKKVPLFVFRLVVNIFALCIPFFRDGVLIISCDMKPGAGPKASVASHRRPLHGFD